GAQLGVLGERYIVVGERPVDHRRGAQHDPVDPDGGRGGEHGLGAAYVVRGAGRGVGLQVEIEGQVHDDVRAAQLLGDRRIPYVQDVPGRLGDLAAPLVDRDDLLDRVGSGEMGGQQFADAGGGAGDRDDGAPVSGGPGAFLFRRVLGRGVGQVSRCANLRIWGTHRASPAVVFSTYPNDAYVPGGVHPAAGRESAEH